MKMLKSPFKFQAATADVFGFSRFAFYSYAGFDGKCFRRLFDATFIYKNYAGHHHCLGLCTRIGKAAVMQKFVNAFLCHLSEKSILLIGRLSMTCCRTDLKSNTSMLF